MAALTTTVVPNTGLRIDNLFVAAGGSGDTCETGAGVNLIVKNGAGSSVTVTVAYPQKYDGDQTVSGRTFTVPATSGEFVIPVRDIYRDPATGRASVTYSSATSVTVAVVRTQVS
ncbi:hypothetical protein [Microbispora sp. KK1-11]|uniref:hypothetical protein n=1 Tax=Microbispora sp. KK1-11 TaxID=2053005 RepID=UPI001158FF5D|nr:hypothetical protein [Microbispora sp. KK1-11]TQS29130.1 hypothetical protein FLW16_12350 [Microbispora sp. KK1-11]